MINLCKKTILIMFRCWVVHIRKPKRMKEDILVSMIKIKKKSRSLVQEIRRTVTHHIRGNLGSWMLTRLSKTALGSMMSSLDWALAGRRHCWGAENWGGAGYVQL